MRPECWAVPTAYLRSATAALDDGILGAPNNQLADAAPHEEALSAQDMGSGKSIPSGAKIGKTSNSSSFKAAVTNEANGMRSHAGSGGGSTSNSADRSCDEAGALAVATQCRGGGGSTTNHDAQPNSPGNDQTGDLGFLCRALRLEEVFERAAKSWLWRRFGWQVQLQVALIGPGSRPTLWTYAAVWRAGAVIRFDGAHHR